MHQCGLTNLDYRTKGDTENVDRYHPTLKYADFGTMGKSQYKRLHSVADPKEQVKITSGWKTMSNITTTPTPLLNPAKMDLTADFYQSKGKKFKQPAQIGKRRETELEQPYWTDKVFTGDNPKATAMLAGQVRERNETYGGSKRKMAATSGGKSDKSSEQRKVALTSAERKSGMDSSQLKRRQDQMADADHETQLVHLKNSVTNEGKIDLAKVQDIIRALRRRYQTRSNINHIFKDWDKSGKGFLSSDDIQTMLEKMGLKVNNDEAKMMLVAIDENGDNQVSLNEFLDLVFTHNDALSGLDLSKAQTLHGANDMSIMDEIKKKAEASKKMRPMNQWKLFLQKNLNNIAMDCLQADFDRVYEVELKDFMKVIERRARAPEYLKQQNGDLLHEFIAEYTDGNTGKVDYRSLIEELRYFNYEEANNSKMAMHADQ